MNSRERVLTSIHHSEPDRVPIGFAGLNETIELKLKKYLGLQTSDQEGLLSALQVDTRVIKKLPYTGPELYKPVQGRIIDPLWGMRKRWIENESGGYWDYCDFPLKEATFEQILNWPMPSPDDFDYSAVRQYRSQYKDYCLVFGDPGWCDVINSTGMLRTMEQTLIDLAMNNEVCLAYIKKRTLIQKEILTRALEFSKGDIDLVWIGEDLGGQNGPLISLEMYRQTLRPIHQEFIDIARAYEVPVMIHSCGSSSWAFNDFIEMGIKVIDTLQPEAKNMEPEYLKTIYGDKLSFHGCFSTAGPLAYGNVDDVKQTVKLLMETLKPKGGYIFAPTHMIQDNTPVENIKQAFMSAVEYGVY